ncbi:MAG: hypothetical protein ACR2JB_02590 [Bryobacteraceae bacterium]
MPEYRLLLDPRNPGQFLACCGLFEIAELLNPGGLATFQKDGTEFLLQSSATLPPSEFALTDASDKNGSAHDPTLEPLELTVGNELIALNWWLNETLTKKSGFKTWGGQQTPRRVLNELLRLLGHSKLVSELFAAKAYTKSRFGVDARSAWEPLDVGYSPNDMRQDAVTFPWVEVLAVIGLQGFRPTRKLQKGSLYCYAAWQEPLPLIAARGASTAPWKGLPALLFEFLIAVRGQGYKTFLFAKGVDHAPVTISL